MNKVREKEREMEQKVVLTKQVIHNPNDATLYLNLNYMIQIIDNRGRQCFHNASKFKNNLFQLNDQRIKYD